MFVTLLPGCLEPVLDVELLVAEMPAIHLGSVNLIPGLRGVFTPGVDIQLGGHLILPKVLRHEDLLPAVGRGNARSLLEEVIKWSKLPTFTVL